MPTNILSNRDDDSEFLVSVSDFEFGLKLLEHVEQASVKFSHSLKKTTQFVSKTPAVLKISMLVLGYLNSSA